MHRRRPLASLARLAMPCALVATLAAGTVVPGARAAGTVIVDGGGSTFVAPLLRTWATAYATASGGAVRVRYQSVGSGAGIQLFTVGAVDFAASDAPLSDAQLADAGGDVLHVPLTLGPVAVAYNLPSLAAPLRLDGPTLARIYLGQIARWDDPALVALNPGAALPHLPIAVAHRSDGSGTTYIFSDYLRAASAPWRAGEDVGADIAWPTGVGGRGNDGVAALVGRAPGGVGYVALSYAVSHHLATALMRNRAGRFVAPSAAGAAAAAAASGPPPADLRARIVDAPGAASYPIAGYSWALIHQRAGTAGKGDTYRAMLAFLWWCVHDGQRFAGAGALRYAPLPAAIVRDDEAALRTVTYRGAALLQS